MPTLDPRVDTYIENAPEFARPILSELRKRIHAACPDVTETIKWRMPSFEYRGLLAGMAAFKKHCSFGFWKDPLLQKEAAHAAALAKAGCLQTLADLPPKAAFQKVVKRAMALNAEGTVVPREMATKKVPPLHPEFVRALAANKKARAVFDAFAPSCKREYAEWIAEAKKDETRARRIEQAIDWIGAGKKRHWKYETC
jgi:uncharacterized protein YdeI (YjbR/CyaY-like superfamily)